MTSGQSPITIRPYEVGYAKFLPEIYRKAVQEIGLTSYSADQIAVWSSLAPSESDFRQRAKDGRYIFVAVDKAGRSVGYADLEPDGHIDHIYCAPDAGRKGLGTALALTLEAHARSKRLKTLRVEASEIARPVFERLGYRIERKRDLTITGVEIHNYAMTKPLPKITGNFAPTPATEAYFTEYQSASGVTDAYQVVGFGDSAVMADELASLVLSGQKRATAALLRDFDQGDSMPFVGAHVVLVDGSGEPRAIWQTVQVRIGVLENVDSSFAWDEGEGARTRDSWLSDHRRYFSRQAENEGFVFDETTAVIFERFQVVWPRP